MNDITNELVSREFQFQSKTGYKHENSTITRHIVFNRLKSNISITGFIMMFAHTESTTFKVVAMDLSGNGGVRIKEFKRDRVEINQGRLEMLEFIDNECLAVA